MRAGRSRGEPVVCGNASKREVLEKLGAERAALIFLALGNPKKIRRTLENIRRAWPGVKPLARARNDDDQGIRHFGDGPEDGDHDSIKTVAPAA